MPKRPGSLILLLLSASAIYAQVDVLTANYDNNRTNANLSESLLNTNNVNPTQFGKLFSYAVDGQVYAQPLYAHAIDVPGKGTLNILVVATMHNSVYAFDADAVSGTAPLWQVNLGTSVDPLSFSLPGFEPYTDVLHEIGILGTPAIDRTGNTIYVVSQTNSAGAVNFFLHALDLSTGAEKLQGPVQIQATVPGAGWIGFGDSVDGVLSLQPAQHLQRPGLLLVNGILYIGFGSHGDYAPWHGWLVAYSASDLHQTAVFNTTPSTAGGAIWQGGRGFASDPNGDVYCSTGNGNYDGVESWSQTVLRLTPTLDVADWFTPASYAGWSQDDLDFGSDGPILVPGTNLLIAGGKSGAIALVDRTNMGRNADGDVDVVQIFQAVPSNLLGMFNAAFWNRPDGPSLYIWGFNDRLRQFQMQNGLFNTTPVAVNTTAVNALPFAGMTVSSNAFVPGSGLFWATSVSNATMPAPGTLRAFDASNISWELWNSDMQPARDSLGNFTKFANPTVANGRVYVPTDSSQLVVYGLLPVPGIRSVVSSAGFAAAAVSPGELITVFGNSLGPANPLQAVIDSQGKLETLLGGYFVTFDDIPAPLLYVSSGQINAIVPFSVSGRATTQLAVAAPDGTRFRVTLPVAAAAPGIFTLNASGQGAILNQDFSVNAPDRPAARGSYIAIYATGTGLLSPAVADGTIVSASNLPKSAAAVTVTVGGLDATVVYQGAAPGLAAGVMQINVQVPAGVAPGPAVPVTLSAGGTPGLNTATVAVN